MRVELDTPIDFEKAPCEVCLGEDDDWLVMHFLHDGSWRTLTRGATLREQGIDEDCTSRLYCIHACTEAMMRTFVSVREVTEFRKALKDPK